MKTSHMMPLEPLAARIRGEYCEMPGLRLTVAQAGRLWQLEASTCEVLLEQLVREAFLYKTRAGAYIALSLTAVPSTRPSQRTAERIPT